MCRIAKRHLALGGLLGLLAGGAGAHPLAPALLDVREAADGAIAVRFKRPRSQTGSARPELRVPEGCEIAARGDEWAEAGSRVETLRLRCEPAGLAGRRLEVVGLERSDPGVVVRVERADGAVARGLLGASHPAFVVPQRESALAVLASYGRLGLAHIGAGLDHLLFVLGLVFLAGGTRRLLLTITAFTLGHSLTLALAALELVRLAAEPVEIGIAASLLYLAVQLTRAGEGARASAPLAACFGLLHGLGFAGALRAAGLPAGGVPLALLGFNVGIELGQLAFVALVLAVAAGLRAAVGARAQTVFRHTRLASAYALGTVAAYWVFERLATLV